MAVVCDDAIGPTSDCTIHEFVVTWIGLDEIPKEVRGYETNIGRCLQESNHICCRFFPHVSPQYLLILQNDGCGNQEMIVFSS